MGPTEIHEQQVSTGVGTAPVAAAPVAATPVATAPVAGVPVGTGYATAVPAAGTSVTHRRVGMWPTGTPVVAAVNFIYGIIALFLAFDFVLRLANANNTGFSGFIFSVGGAISAPFYSVFNNQYLADVVAFVVYGVIAYIIGRLIAAAAYRSSSSSTTTTTAV